MKTITSSLRELGFDEMDANLFRYYYSGYMCVDVVTRELSAVSSDDVVITSFDDYMKTTNGLSDFTRSLLQNVFRPLEVFTSKNMELAVKAFDGETYLIADYEDIDLAAHDRSTGGLEPEDYTTYNPVTKVLIIVYPNYGSEKRNRGELFDWLGDHNIILATELHPDAIISDEDVYHMSNQDEMRLAKDGQVTLSYISSLENYIDKTNPDHLDFMEWFYH